MHVVIDSGIEELFESEAVVDQTAGASHRYAPKPPGSADQGYRED